MTPSAGTPSPNNDIETQAQNWLLRLRRGDMADQAAFEDWFAADPAHADAYERLLASWDMTGLMAQTPIGRDRTLFASWRSAARGRSRLLAIAAMFLIILGAGALSLAGLGRSPADAVILSSKVGEIATHKLSDGSAVTLDSDSKIEVRFTRQERRIRLVRGRARFSVAQDQIRPFTVGTPLGVVVARDDILDVATSSRQTVIGTIQGATEIRPTDGAMLHLAPGQQVALGNQAEAKPQPLAPPATRWVTGMLSFDNARLGDVVAAANRYNATRIILTREPVAELRFSGTFRAADAPGLARMLAAAFHLTIRRDASGNYLLAPTAETPPTK